MAQALAFAAQLVATLALLVVPSLAIFLLILASRHAAARVTLHLRPAAAEAAKRHRGRPASRKA